MDTKEIIIRCEIPFLIRTDNPEDDEFQFFTIPTDNYTAEIGFRMAPGGGRGNITTAAGADEDRLGHVSTTHVKAKFGGDFIRSIPEEVHELPGSAVFQMGGGNGQDEYSYYAEELTICINKFISIYKNQTDSYWMRNLLPHDIFDFAIVKVDNEGNESKTHHKHSASVMSGMGSTLSDDEISGIKQQLNTEKVPSIYSRLQLKLRNQISLKQYSLAVVDSQRLMESWIKEAFEHLLKELEGKSKVEAEKIARHQDGSFKDFHDIRKMYDSKLGFDLEATTEFQNWKNIAKGLRNDIIHEGFEPSETEAVEAVRINIDLIMVIKSQFGGVLRSDMLEVNKMPDDGIGRTTFGSS